MKAGAVVRYGVLTVARDEEAHLPRLAAALARQTVRPAMWLIVNDASEDDTADLVDELVRHEWIKSLSVTSGPVRARGAGLISVGMAELLRSPIDILATVDADVSFPPAYFNRVLKVFASDSRLGIVSGLRHEWVAGAWRARPLTGISVAAQCRMYRRAVIASLVPLEAHAGWDGVDVVRAHLNGWETNVDPNLSFRHHRARGARDGPRVNGWKIEGRAAWAMHYRPSYLLLRTAYHCLHDAGAVGLPLGYVTALVRHEPRCSDAGICRFIRSPQRLRHVPRRRSETARRDTTLLQRS